MQAKVKRFSITCATEKYKQNETQDMYSRNRENKKASNCRMGMEISLAIDEQIKSALARRGFRHTELNLIVCSS
jgi:hypothetical protein